MSGNAAIIKSLAEKVERLMEDDRRVRKEREELAAANRKLTSANQELKQAIALLEKRLKVAELGGGLAGGADTKQAKARINHLMREIDRCIALMNM